MRLTRGSVRAALRAATAESHARVDQAFARFELGQPEGYRLFLQAHARALLPLEGALEQSDVARVLPDWPDRRRRDAVSADLQEVGASVPVGVPVQLRADQAYLWGALYALEGSRLGGRMLARQTSGPARYLTHGQHQRLWPTFLDQLEAAKPDQTRAAEGARLVFSVFEAAVRSA